MKHFLKCKWFLTHIFPPNKVILAKTCIELQFESKKLKGEFVCEWNNFHIFAPFTFISLRNYYRIEMCKKLCKSKESLEKFDNHFLIHSFHRERRSLIIGYMCYSWQPAFWIKLSVRVYQFQENWFIGMKKEPYQLVFKALPNSSKINVLHYVFSVGLIIVPYVPC